MRWLLRIKLYLYRFLRFVRRGLKLPVSHCRYGALGQQWMAAHNVDFLHCAVGCNLSLEFHGPTDVHGTGQCRVYRRSLNQDFSGAFDGFLGASS